MKSTICIIFIITSLSLCSCVKNDTKHNQNPISKEQEIILRLLEWLNTADAVYDAKQAIKKDSIYFIAYNGYAMIVPGVNNYYKTYSKNIPVKIIDGTGDCITSQEMKELNNKAREYGLQFNSVMLYHLRK